MAALLLALLLQDKPQTGGPFAIELQTPQTRYWAYVPDEYDSRLSWPLMVVLHGAGDTAENFIGAFTGNAAKHKVIVAAVKSRGQAWDDSDGDLILGVLADVQKRYAVDPDRTTLAGYSSGGFMATRWGFRNTKPWRAIAAVGGAEPGGGREYKDAIPRMAVLVVCGQQDPNLSVCKSVFEKVKKDGFDCESNWVAGMPHSPLKPEVFDWVFDRIRQRVEGPADLMRRGKKAAGSKRYADAVAAFKSVPAGDKLAKSASAELAKIEKLGNDRLAEAEKKLVKDREAARKLLSEIARVFFGLECASKAEERLKE